MWLITRAVVMGSNTVRIREAHYVLGATINSDNLIRYLGLIGGTSINDAKEGAVSDKVC